MVNKTFKGVRFDWLVQQKPAYEDALAKETGPDFLELTFARFCKRFPIDMPLDKDPTPEFLAAVNDDAPEPEVVALRDDLSEEELEAEMTKRRAREALIKKRKKQVKNWYEYQYMKDHNHDPKRTTDDNPYSAVLAALTGKELSPRPRQKSAVNCWCKTEAAYINEVVRQTIIAERTPKHQGVKVWNRVAHEQFKLLAQEERDKWERRAKDDHAAALAVWKASKDKKISEKPEDRQRCIEGLVRFGQPIIDAMAAATGFKIMLMAGGPEPAAGGQLNVISLNAGSTNGDVKLNFGQVARQEYLTQILPVFSKFLMSCYTPAMCKSRALPDGVDADSLDDMLLGDKGVTLDEAVAPNTISTLSVGPPALPSEVPSVGPPANRVLPSEVPSRPCTPPPNHSRPITPLPSPSNQSRPTTPLPSPSNQSRPTTPLIIPQTHLPQPNKSPSRLDEHVSINGEHGNNSDMGAPVTLSVNAEGSKDTDMETGTASTNVDTDVFQSPASSTVPAADTVPKVTAGHEHEHPHQGTAVSEKNTPAKMVTHTEDRHPETDNGNKNPCPDTDTDNGDPSSKTAPEDTNSEPVADPETAPGTEQPHTSTQGVDGGTGRRTSGRKRAGTTLASTPVSKRGRTSKASNNTPAVPQTVMPASKRRQKAKVTDNTSTQGESTSTFRKDNPWFEAAISMMNDDSLGEAWRNLLAAWTRFEEDHANAASAVFLPSKGRPPAVGDWIQRGRSSAWRPVIKDSKLYGDIHIAWWTSLQPEWRINEDFAKTDGGDMESLRKPGKNGLLSILASLFYWGLAVKAVGKKSKRWTESVLDVTYVLSQLTSVA